MIMKSSKRSNRRKLLAESQLFPLHHRHRDCHLYERRHGRLRQARAHYRNQNCNSLQLSCSTYAPFCSYEELVARALASAIETENIFKVKELLQMNGFVFSLPNNTTCSTNSQHNIDRSTALFSHDCKIFKPIDWSNLQLNSEKDNALHYASRLGKTCLIDVLLDTGYFDVNCVSIDSVAGGDTPLTIACDCGWLDTAKLLIARGAEVNYETRKCKTPLILSTELVAPYDLQMCLILLRSGATVNATTGSGNTALLSAAKYGNWQLIRMLVQAGANLSSHFGYDGSTALMRACYYNYPSAVPYLLMTQSGHKSLELRNNRGESALYIASFRGHLDIARLLVEDYKADVNAADMDGDTPLSVACYEERSEVIDYLLRCGAIVNMRGIRGDTPIHVAVSNCDLGVCEQLVAFGANVDAINDENETALHICARQGRLDVLPTLLRYAKRLDQVAQYGNTPFKSLIENIDMTEKLEMALIMIKTGCDVNRSFNAVDPSPLEYLLKLRHSQRFDRSRESNDEEMLIEYVYNELDEFVLIESSPAAQTLAQSQSISTTVSIDTLIRLIECLIKAGYEPTERDVKHYKENFWTYDKEYNKVAKCCMDQLIVQRCMPRSLSDLCRIAIRSCLTRPIINSLNLLKIPISLKSFICLE
jgi:ankyrin repeat protein